MRPNTIKASEKVDPKALLAERQGPTKTSGTKFKALVRYANTISTETLTLLPLHPLHVVIRMQASQTCYSTTGQLNTMNPAPFAAVAGHGGVGIIEEVGRLVKRVKVGDQVMLATTPNCGVCWNCLSGRGDLCNTRLPAIPNATMADNTPVYMTAPPVGPASDSQNDGGISLTFDQPLMLPKATYPTNKPEFSVL